MRVFEVAIKKARNGVVTTFEWPKWWGEVVAHVNVVAYEDEGKSVEGAICICDETTWKKIEKKGDSLVRELTIEEANEKGRKWKPQDDVVVDPATVIKAVAKATRGGKLSNVEKKALDPIDPTPGINRTPLFDIERLMAEMEGEA